MISLLKYKARMRHLRRQTGAVTVEYAISILMVSAIILGTIEISNFLWQIRKMEKTANSVVNILQTINLSSTLTASQLTGFQQIISEEAGLNLDEQFVIVTHAIEDKSAANPLDDVKVNWQVEWGTLAGVTSTVYPSGATEVNLPNGQKDMTTDEGYVVLELHWKPRTITNGALFDFSPKSEIRQLHYIP